MADNTLLLMGRCVFCDSQISRKRATISRAVSVMMNFRFGQSLGRTEWDGLIYGMASGCADGFKVILPFAIVGAWSSGRRVASSSGAALWLVFTAYSLTSSLGHSAVNRAQTAGERRHQVEGYTDLRRSIEMRLKERETLPPFRALTGLSAQREAATANYRFERTRGCKEVSRVDQSFCDELTRLEIEIASAKRASELDAELERLRQRLQRTSDVARSGESDAQTMILREMSGLAENYVRLGLTVLVSLMVELGSGLGMYVVLGAGMLVPTCRRRPRAGSDRRRLCGAFSSHRPSRAGDGRAPCATIWGMRAKSICIAIIVCGWCSRIAVRH